MRFIALSDTHGKHRKTDLPEGDVILHAGDVTRKGTPEQVADFLDWFSGLDYDVRIFVAGNHDFLFEDEPGRAEAMVPGNVIYLNDSGCDVDGLKIWGSPIQPWFRDWAFNRRPGADIRNHWDLIPDATDILITHGPPKGVRDRTFFFKHVGCPDLRDTVERIRPKVHLFGHIHEAYGEKEQNGIRYINASVLNLRYKYANAPVLFEL